LALAAEPAPGGQVAAEASAPSRGVELRLKPIVAQVLSADTEHAGSGLAVLYRPSEGFAVGLSGTYHWLLQRKGQSIDELLHHDVNISYPGFAQWVALLTTEMTPLRGELVIESLGPFGLAVGITGGVGAVSTRKMLMPESPTTGPASFGDTGLQLAGSAGVLARVRFGKHVAVQLGFDLLVYSSRTTTVNGCTATDLVAMDGVLRAGLPFSGIAVSRGCNLASFDGVDPGTGRNRSEDVPLGKNSVVNPSSELIRHANLSLGVSWTF
jgi:hypothetical protein